MSGAARSRPIVARWWSQPISEKVCDAISGGGRGNDDAARPRERVRPGVRGGARVRPVRPARHRRQSARRSADARSGPYARLSDRLREGEADIGTIAATIVRDDERSDPNVVKVIGSPLPAQLDACARSISRGRPPPTARARSSTISASTPMRRAALERFVALPPSPLEMRERLEQLRALEAGMRIHVGLVDTVPLGVDTPPDLERARQLMQSRRK